MTNENSKNVSQNLPAIACFAALIAYAAAMTMPQASVNQMGREFGVTNNQLGTLFTFFMIGFLIAAVGGGKISDRLGKLPMIVVGCIFLAAGMVMFAHIRRFDLLPYAALVAGLGGGLAEVVATALLSDVYHGPQKTKMMNYSQVAFSAGAVAQPLLFAQMLSMGINWRNGFLLAAGLSVACAVLVAIALPRLGRMALPHHEESVSWHKIIRNLLVLRLSASLLLYVGGEIGLASWVAAYLEKDLGASAPMAASAVAIFWVGIGVGRVVGARVSSRLHDYTLIRWAFFLGAAFQAVLLLTHSPLVGLILTFLAGFFLGPTWPTIMSCAGAAFPKDSGAVIGIVAAAGCTGAAIVPKLVGWASDTAGLRSSLWICVVALLLGLVMMNVGGRKRGGTAHSAAPPL